MKIKHFIIAILVVVVSASCVTNDPEPNTNKGNVEACWKILNEHYCFFEEKKNDYGVDWDEVHEKYAHAIANENNKRQLFEVLEAMICELRDGHVNIYTPFDVAKYAAWYEDYPTNYSDSLIRKYLGRSDDFAVSGILKYRILPNNIGYIRCATFNAPLGDGNLNEVMMALKTCNGLIIDIRNNGGGILTSAQKLASAFINEKECVGYIRHKTGPAHGAFSGWKSVELRPFVGLRWQKRVCVLTNRRTFSAANAFASYMKGREGVLLVGDRTGGGAGLPFSADLPNGWTIRFSACPMYDAKKHCTEEGIAPDVKVSISSEDYQQSDDTIIERAIALLMRTKDAAWKINSTL